MFYLNHDFFSNPTPNKEKNSNLAIQLYENLSDGSYTLYTKSLRLNEIEQRQCNVCKVSEYDASNGTTDNIFQGGKAICSSSKSELTVLLRDKDAN